MERFARTVLGDIKGEEMGFTYPHEHLHAVPPPCQKDRDLELSSYETVSYTHLTLPTIA